MLNKYIKGIASNGMSSFLLKVFGFMVGVSAARTLPLEEYQIYAVAIAGLVVFGNSIANSLSMYVAANCRGVIAPRTAFKAVVAFLFIYLATLVAVSVIGDALGFSYDVRVFSVMALVVFSPLLGLVNGYGKYHYFMISGFVSVGVVACASWVGKSYLVGVDDFILVYVMPYAFLFLMFIFLVRQIVLRLLSPTSDREFKIVLYRLRKIVILVGAAVVVPLVIWVVYKYYDGVGGELYLYASAMQWSFMLSQLAVVVGGVIFSSLKGRQHDDMNLYSVWLPVFVVGVFVSFFPSFHLFIFGDRFDESGLGVTLSMVMMVTVLNAAKSSIGRNIVVANASSLSFFSNVLWGVGCISLVVSFSGDKDSVFLATVFLLSNVLVFVCMLPFYFSKSLVSKKMFLDRRSIFLWLGWLMLPVPTVLEMSFGLRVILFLVCIILVFFVFFLRPRRAV